MPQETESSRKEPEERVADQKSRTEIEREPALREAERHHGGKQLPEERGKKHRGGPGDDDDPNPEPQRPEPQRPAQG